MINLYSYADSWSCKSSSKTLRSSIKWSYLKKSLILLVQSPLELILIVLFKAFVDKSKIEILVLTNKYLELNKLLALNSTIAIIGLPSNAIFCYKHFCEYFSIAPTYLLATIGLFVSRSQQKRFSRLVVLMAKFQLRSYSSHNFKVVVHSDALPFARAYILAANELGMHTICIQHGSFYKSHQVGERDGFLCKTNIVRSSLDGELIKFANKDTNIYVANEFFKLKVSPLKKSINEKITIMLLGEGFHVMDEEFESGYMAALKKLNTYYSNMNIKVLFRPHPSEYWFQYFGDFKFIDRLQLNKSLARVDAVIGFSSSVLLEAAQIGIPCFHIAVDGIVRDGLNRDGLVVHALDSPYAAVEAAQDYFELRAQSAMDDVNPAAEENLMKFIMSI